MSANLDESIDFDKVAAELIRVLRGTRSQTALSRKLGFRTNQLYRWEAGLRTPSWEDFIKLSRAVEAPLDERLKTTLIFLNDPTNGSELVQHLMQDLPISRVASLTGVSRFTITRWVSRKSEPGLSDVLQLMHRLWNLLFVFLDEWIKPEDLPSLGIGFLHYKREKDLFYSHPLCTAILESLKLEKYKDLEFHSGDWVASIIGADVETVSQLISELQSIGCISKVKMKYKVLRSFSPKNGNFALYKDVRKFWFKKALDFYEKRSVVPEHSLAPALTFACSESAMQSILTSYRIFLTEMQSILSNDKESALHLMVHSSTLLELNDKAGNEGK